MKNLILTGIALCGSIGLFAQTTTNYAFNSTEVFSSPVPTPVNGIYPATDFTQVAKPMVSEGFATNEALVANSNLVWSAAGNHTDVYFGGDAPDIVGLGGRRASPIVISETYDLSDFPIKLEGMFFNRSGDALYNESYFWIGPANYIGFSGWYVSSSEKQGILIGESPEKFVVSQGISTGNGQNVIVETNHNHAQYNTWYPMEVVLDVVNGELTVNDVRINGQLYSGQSLVATVPNINYLNNFRLAMHIDDMGRDFKVTTNYGDSTSVGIKDIQTNVYHVEVFPNPSTDMINVQLKNSANIAAKISVYNQLGQEVSVLFNGVLDDKFNNLQFAGLKEKLGTGLFYLIITEENQIVGSKPLRIE